MFAVVNNDYDITKIYSESLNYGFYIIAIIYT